MKKRNICFPTQSQGNFSCCAEHSFSALVGALPAFCVADRGKGERRSGECELVPAVAWLVLQRGRGSGSGRM